MKNTIRKYKNKDLPYAYMLIFYRSTRAQLPAKKVLLLLLLLCALSATGMQTIKPLSLTPVQLAEQCYAESGGAGIPDSWKFLEIRFHYFNQIKVTSN